MYSRLAVASLVIGLLGCQGAKDKKITLETQTQKASYSIGIDIGKNFKHSNIEIDLEALMQGVKDAISDSTPKLTEQQMEEAMRQLQQDVVAKRNESSKILGEKNKLEGEAFIAENAKKEGVITLPSGLQYKILKQGDGKKPKLTDEVKTNYRGTLIDGTEFDSSYKRGEPASFHVNEVIAGWTEALQLMPVGSKWQLFIPSNLAYGERGAGGSIGPNATLIFEIELLSIN
ncbi:FKBP-type peptidyl-prolyl cis-trans isomerase [candidate division KSB1 bacterium]|nr:FKBP-type peptidyl-prolyl cis-trans isomerase [candidate division KSB1 bacterium]